jgi:hypothetical protein
MLQDAILQSREDTSLKEAVDGLNTTVRQEASRLRQEFSQVSGVDIDVHLPEDMEELFRAFAVSTGGTDEFPLTVRGDGIQARFLPSLLHHVAERSTRVYIWGFEEPENCLEHGLATRLANDITEQYSQRSQILLTSHSPAFVTLRGDRVAVFRVQSQSKQTEVLPLEAQNESLSQDLGLLDLQRQYQADYIAQLDTMKKTKELLEEHIATTQMPILLVEGKSDVPILEEAWKRCNQDKQCPFKIISSDVSQPDSNDSKAGCGILKKALESCRTDQPKMIGLFDRDSAGLKAFQLDNNYEVASFSQDVKVSKNGHAAALVIPALQGKEAYAGVSNLPLEFLFPEECITKKVEGKGLELEQPKIQKKCGPITVSEEDSSEPHLRKVKGGEIFFAQYVVPTFIDKDFESFREVFRLLLEILKNLK